jgi:hypothetical protein
LGSYGLVYHSDISTDNDKIINKLEGIV